MTTTNKDIVIVGGGIIGSTLAYYLSRHPSPKTITLIEASSQGVAQGASGKAGGLVAKWAYPKELVNVSFHEHVKLAQRHDGKNRWGWRYVNCGSLEATGSDPSKTLHSTSTDGKSLEKTLGLDEPYSAASGMPSDLDWIDGDAASAYSPMARQNETAQVHPFLFTKSMMDLAVEEGVKLHLHSTVTSLEQSEGRVTGVIYKDAQGSDHHVTATDVVVCAGAWAPRLIPTLPIVGTRAHSVTIHPETRISPYVLFTEIQFRSDHQSSFVSPEIYARPDNEVYACGPGDSSALPENVDDVVVDEDACDSLWRHVASISSVLKDGKVDKRQACFLPVVSTGGGPLIGRLPDMQGLYISCGHTCWGICNAPGSALAATELIMEQKIQCANLSKLDPSRYCR